MSKKLRQVVAIIALVLVLIFTVSFIMYLTDSTLLNGSVGFLALFSGGFGLALFLVVRLTAPKAQEEEEEPSADAPADKKADSESENPAPKIQSDKEKEDEKKADSEEKSA